MKKSVKVVVAVIVLILIVTGMYVYSLTQITLKDISVDELRGISLSGFDIGGEIELFNGGILPVAITNINYVITLDASGDTLATGNIVGKTIMPQQSTRFPFSSTINWIPSAEAAVGLVGGNTYAKITGVASVVEFGPIAYKVPFEKKVNLEQYIRQFVIVKANQAVESVQNTITQGVQTIGNAVKEGVNTIAEGAQSFFNQITGQISGLFK